MYFSVLSSAPFKFVVLFSTCLLRCAMQDSFAMAKKLMGKPTAEQQDVLAYEHLFGNYANNDCGSRQLNLMLQRFILFITQLRSAALTLTDTMSPPCTSHRVTKIIVIFEFLDHNEWAYHLGKFSIHPVSIHSLAFIFRVRYTFYLEQPKL